MDQCRGPGQRRALQDCQVREDKVPCDSLAGVHRDLRLGTQTISQVYGF